MTNSKTHHQPPSLPPASGQLPPNRHSQIKIRTARDLFSIVPYALGYQPEESLMVICLRAQGGLGMMARTSLLDLTSHECCVEIGEMVARSAADDEATRAFIVVYCHATDEFTLHAHKKHAKTFAEALAGIPSETWVINAERYFRVDCEGEGCCPPDGFPVSELHNTEASAALVYRGYAPAPTREDYLRLPQPNQTQSAAAHRAETRFSAEQRKLSTTWRQKAFTTWQRALDLVENGKPVPASTLGLLGAALTDTTMRDAVLVSCLPGGSGAAQHIIDHPGVAQQAASRLLAQVVGDTDDGENVMPPPRLALRKFVTLLEAVAAHASPGSKPGPLSLLAFLAWWSGDGTRASARAREALEITPEYRLAQTLAEALEAHLQPGWIRARHDYQVAA